MSIQWPHGWMTGLPGRSVAGWCALAGVMVVGLTSIGGRTLSFLGGLLDRLGRRAWGVATVGMLAFLIEALIAGWAGIPQPQVHDEFSYLLAADTFAHGRLTNPPHPLWPFFESIHIITQPTYQSKYPPGQGLVLALGQVVAGMPIVGVWLAVGCACAAAAWMLLAVLPARWAMAGGLLAAVHPEMILWGQSYWGGALAMAGGAMVIGGVARIVKGRPSLLAALMAGMGMAILINTRPFEGGLVCVMGTGALVCWGVRAGWKRAAMVVWPGAVALGTVVSWMGYYNYRVTGSALVLPYMVHERTYGMTPHWVWGKLRPAPAYHHPELREFHEKWEADQWREQQTWRGWARVAVGKSLVMAALAFEPASMLLILLALPGFLRRQQWGRWMLGTAAVVGIGELGVTWALWPHYLAPVAGAWAAVAVGALAALAQWRYGRSAAVLVGVMLLIAAVRAVAGIEQAETQGWVAKRQQIIGALEQEPGRHLVIVRYLPGHNPHQEWVYNLADIDRQRIIWARDMGEQEDRKLLAYYKGRRIWLLESDQEHVRMNPYAR